MSKSKYIRARISETLKDNFNKKLQEEGITESEFLTACVINFLQLKTIPDNIKSMVKRPREI